MIAICASPSCGGAAASTGSLMLVGVDRPAVAAAYVGPADIVASPVAFWGLRAMSAATAGNNVAIVCDAADAHCNNINTLAGGDFNLAAATGGTTTCTDNSCTIKTLYDQTGAGNDVTNALIADRPTLHFPCISGKACMASASTTIQLGRSTFTSTAAVFTVIAVAERTNSNIDFATFFGSGAGNGVQFLFTNVASQVSIYNGSGLATASATDNNAHSLIGMWNAGSSSITVDGSTTSVSLVGSNALGTATNVFFPPTTAYNGEVMEVGVWASNLTTSLTALSHNQCAYWGTPTAC
jgi:hypothetical protein